MITYQHSALAFPLKFCLTHHLNGHIWTHTKEKNQRMAKNKYNISFEWDGNIYNGVICD